MTPILFLFLGLSSKGHKLFFLSMNLIPAIANYATTNRQTYWFISYPILLALIYDGSSQSNIPYYYLTTILIILLLIWAKSHINIETSISLVLLTLLGSAILVGNIYVLILRVKISSLTLLSMFFISFFSNLILIIILNLLCTRKSLK